ncbi:MAG: hypothetical protein J2P54_16285 [Bradyrhizobiaceae bacterium]|nr:hypothetical protein [Bradyrhizobiaceae bacterium]
MGFIEIADVDLVYAGGPGASRRAGTLAPRPRTLDMTFESRFVDLVHECRHHIGLGKTS